MLCAASMMLGLTSRRLLSASLATNGNDAMTRGTIDATVPTDVPTMARVKGITMIIKIRNGTLLKRFITVPIIHKSHEGRGRTPPFSPATSNTPRGRPIMTAKSVDKSVT